jgi:hypothetical protein
MTLRFILSFLIIYIMEEPGQAPFILIFAEMPGQGPHNSLHSQGVLNEVGCL